MSTLLRRFKTTIHASSTLTSKDDSSRASTRDSSQVYSSPISKSTRTPRPWNKSSEAVGSSSSVHLQPQQNQKRKAIRHHFAEITGRLVRKASTISPREAGKSNHRRKWETQQTKDQATAWPEKELPEPPSTFTVCSSPFVQDKERISWDINSSRSTVILSGDRLASHRTTLDSFPSPPKGKQGIATQRPAKAPTKPLVTLTGLQSLQNNIRLKQRLLVQNGCIQPSNTKEDTVVIMAAENAAPPVPYSRLQELTIQACDKALSSVSSYNHAFTEEWNTTIINTILGTLVSETIPASDKPSSAQPQFKYVVNSTIIQHAPTSSGASADPAVTGRRGMHAASGAYWNNEKDGMWSYKYSAAEKKGLDVVVGIIWIWVG